LAPIDQASTPSFFEPRATIPSAPSGSGAVQRERETRIVKLDAPPRERCDTASVMNDVFMRRTAYRVVRQKDLTYAVEVTEPGRASRHGVGFKTEDEAEAWADANDRQSDRVG
jgi:hypothetical protein